MNHESHDTAVRLAYKTAARDLHYALHDLGAMADAGNSVNNQVRELLLSTFSRFFLLPEEGKAGTSAYVDTLERLGIHPTSEEAALLGKVIHHYAISSRVIANQDFATRLSNIIDSPSFHGLENQEVAQAIRNLQTYLNVQTITSRDESALIASISDTAQTLSPSGREELIKALQAGI